MNFEQFVAVVVFVSCCVCGGHIVAVAFCSSLLFWPPTLIGVGISVIGMCLAGWKYLEIAEEG